MLKTAIPVIHFSDSRKAEAFYWERLGFSVVSSWRPSEANQDPCSMLVSRDGARLHLASFKDGVVGTWTSTVYVFVDDVEALHAEFVAKGIATQSAPFDQTWGTREIGVRDADRNVITFGRRVAKQAST